MAAGVEHRYDGDYPFVVGGGVAAFDCDDDGRVDLFLDELLTFVADPAVPADNNLAERSLRPLVIARKVSGGSRSPEGSRVRMALASLFATWQAQGRDPLAACPQTLLALTL